MKKYLVSAATPEKEVKHTVVFHTAHTQEQLLNNFDTFYKKRAPQSWESFVGPHIEMQICDGDLVRHHINGIDPKLHIHNTENNNHPYTLCFTLPIPSEEEALKKLKSWTLGSLYTLLYNEDFVYKYEECNGNDEQFTGLMEEKFGISYAIEEIPS